MWTSQLNTSDCIFSPRDQLGRADADYGSEQQVLASPGRSARTGGCGPGRTAAADAARRMRDVVCRNVGRRLVDAIPQELRHPEFEYSFKVVNVREINAFALPGGPMYVNRGMIEAAKTEGEVAGVMAHELSHVALRHGTAQASKATKYEIGAIVGAVLGAIIGGNVGSVVAQGTQFGLGTAFLRFSREYETSGGPRGRADHGAGRLRPASTWRTCSRRSRSRADRAARSG